MNTVAMVFFYVVIPNVLAVSAWWIWSGDYKPDQTIGGELWKIIRGFANGIVVGTVLVVLVAYIGGGVEAVKKTLFDFWSVVGINTLALMIGATLGWYRGKYNAQNAQEGEEG